MGNDGGTIRRVVLEVVRDLARDDSLQQGTALREAAQRLGVRGNQAEQALLTVWFDLFRNGQLSWGLNLANQNPPFCHLTDVGRKTLETLSRDPANPDGYLAHLRAMGGIDAVTQSYISEALTTYNSNCFKATAVLVGAAAESIVLYVRNDIGARMVIQNRALPKNWEDWRIKLVLDALQKEFETHKTDMPNELANEIGSYWPAFTQQIRTTRNEAGHPVSVEPVTPEAVHSALLIFPELARVGRDIRTWAATYYV
jgi:hypothetical protein